MKAPRRATRALLRRYVLVLLCFLATFICYIVRVNISVAIIPMAEEFGWSSTTKGLVLSSFFIGYRVAMIPAAVHGVRAAVGRPRGASSHWLASTIPPSPTIRHNAIPAARTLPRAAAR